MRRATIIKHVDREELERMYREEKDARIKERLLAIIHIYDGKSISDTASIVKRSTSSVKRWLYAWNREAYNGLIPRFTAIQSLECHMLNGIR
jgi:predicted transcriptional regulator